jgi:hypothetical protein
MSPEVPNPSNPEDLSPQQSLILEGFVQAYYPKPRTPQESAAYDQSVASMKENITDGFGLEMETPQEFYTVMAGLSAATDKMVKLVEMGLPAQTASEVLRHSLAGLAPQELKPQSRQQ